VEGTAWLGDTLADDGTDAFEALAMQDGALDRRSEKSTLLSDCLCTGALDTIVCAIVAASTRSCVASKPPGSGNPPLAPIRVSYRWPAPAPPAAAPA
jgi:hypothetical protein